MDVWRFRAWEVLTMDTVDVSARVPVVGGGTSVCMPVAFFFRLMMLQFSKLFCGYLWSDECKIPCLVSVVAIYNDWEFRLYPEHVGRFGTVPP